MAPDFTKYFIFGGVAFFLFTLPVTIWYTASGLRYFLWKRQHNGH